MKETVDTLQHCFKLVAKLSPDNSLRVHRISLVGVEEYRLPITSIDVALPTPHDYSGTFQGGYSARFTASKRVLEGAIRALYHSKNSYEILLIPHK